MKYYCVKREGTYMHNSSHNNVTARLPLFDKQQFHLSYRSLSGINAFNIIYHSLLQIMGSHTIDKPHE